MKKTLAVILLTCLVPAAYAQAADIDFNGNVASACTFSSVTSGTVAVSGASLTTTAPATYTVTNNDPSTFSVVVPTVTTFASAPGSADLAGDLGQTVSVVTGPNVASNFVGSDAAGYTLSLANVGSDDITHSVSGSVTDVQAGSYLVRVPVTCVSV